MHRLKGSITAPFRLTSIESNALRAWIRKRGTAAGPIFLSRNHKPISSDRVNELMHAFSAKAGLPAEKSHPHALKHSCGTHVLAKLGDITLGTGSPWTRRHQKHDGICARGESIEGTGRGAAAGLEMMAPTL